MAAFDTAAEVVLAFVAAGLVANHPLKLVNHPDGHHGLDTVDPTDASSRAVRRVLTFLADHLAGR